CVRLKTELFEANDRLRKVASSDRKTITEVSGLHYAPKLTLRDVVKQTETDLSIEKIEIGAEIPDRLFSQTQLTKGKQPESADPRTGQGGQSGTRTSAV